MHALLINLHAPPEEIKGSRVENIISIFIDGSRTFLHFYPIPTFFNPLYPATAVANRRQCGIGISFRAKRRGRSSFFSSPNYRPSIVVPGRDCVRLVHARATRRDESAREEKERDGRYRNKPRQDLITISRGA